MTKSRPLSPLDSLSKFGISKTRDVIFVPHIICLNFLLVTAIDEISWGSEFGSDNVFSIILTNQRFCFDDVVPLS